MKTKSNLQTWEYFILPVLIAFLLCAIFCCTWPGYDIIIDPPPPPPQDSLPAEPDTVCTTYDDVLLPEFIGSYMEMDSYSGNRTFVVGPYSTIVTPGEDPTDAISSMLDAYLTDTSIVYVNNADDRRIYILTKGTNDKSVLLGKIHIKYNGFKHYFGVISQSLITAGALTADEMEELIVNNPSLRYIAWWGTAYDSTRYIKQADLAIDTAHCKGGRDWMDFRHNPYQMLQRVYDDADDAGWGFVGENFGTIDLTGRAIVSEGEIMYYLKKGYSVKVKQ